MNAQSKVKAEKRTLADGVAFAMPLADFLAVKQFISTEEIRYYLAGVRIEAHEGGAIAVATDGHRLGVQFSPEGKCAIDGIWVCPKELKLDRRKGAPAQWVVGTINGSRGRLHLIHAKQNDKDADMAKYVSGFPEAGIDEMSWGQSLIDGSYPDWQDAGCPLSPPGFATPPSPKRPPPIPQEKRDGLQALSRRLLRRSVRPRRRVRQWCPDRHRRGTRRPERYGLPGRALPSDVGAATHRSRRRDVGQRYLRTARRMEVARPHHPAGHSPW